MLDLRDRRQLERDLHDGAQQRLVSLALTLRMAREKLGPDAGEAGRLLDLAREELEEALREIRELARGIHPAVLADRGLGAAVEALASRAPLPVVVGATQASVTVTNAGGPLAVEVSDDGVGGADAAAGTGLRGLCDRLAAIGGRFEIDSQPGRGTTVRASIPAD